MQKTRQKIIEYLKANGEATVDELSVALNNLTAVTVRHHLDVLRGQGLVDAPEVRHRNSPGRPKYIYRLTDRGHGMFPSNLAALTHHIVDEMKGHLSDSEVNVIFDGVAQRMADHAPDIDEDESLELRLDRVVEHLTDSGYIASWESHPEGFVLHTSNCPYAGVARSHDEVCQMDMRYIALLLGTIPRRLSHIVAGQPTCSYLVMAPNGQAAAQN
ncbi:MAG: ArsR family transcriptional regulator [Chloroflexi bacterium]|nr:ArsR family transcriptional regulator [Chloroflexota bacterium]